MDEQTREKIITFVAVISAILGAIAVFLIISNNFDGFILFFLILFMAIGAGISALLGAFIGTLLAYWEETLGFLVRSALIILGATAAVWVLTQVVPV